MKRDGWEMVSACGEVGGNWWKVGLCSHLKNEAHADNYVEQEVTVEKPETGIVGPKTKDDVTVVGDCDRIFCRWKVSLFKVTFKQTSSIKVESVFQVDFLNILIRRTANTNHVVRVTVQVERMR